MNFGKYFLMVIDFNSRFQINNNSIPFHFSKEILFQKTQYKCIEIKIQNKKDKFLIHLL